MSRARRFPTLQERLAQAFRESGSPSNREVARRMLALQKVEPSQAKVSSLRAQISKWRNTPGVGISDANAQLLAQALRLRDETYLMKSRASPAPEEYQREVRRLRREQAKLQKRVEDLERRAG